LQFFIKPVSTIRFGDQNIDLPQQQGDKAEFSVLIKGWLQDIMFGAEDNEWGVVVDIGE
jgi:branched-chain amino acid aminotransferase